jgi:circadian clock protein KaiC
MGLSDKLDKKRIEKKVMSKPREAVPSKERDIDKIAEAVAEKIKARTPKQQKVITKEIEKQRKPLEEAVERTKDHKKFTSQEWVKTGVEGLDELFVKGIPRGTSTLVAGGAGSGKTVLLLQILNHAATNGEKCLYISLEESEFRLKKHMHDFGWEPEKLEEKGLLKIKRVKPFTIAREVEALLAKEKGELKMSVEEIGELIPEGFKPQWVVIDSLTALASAFKDEETTYRIYIEQLFKYLETLGATSFLISETEQMPTKFSKTGVEEFLADGVIVLYQIKHENIRENAIEILKLRGAGHQKKIVAMQILGDKGIVVHPEQEVIQK